MSSAKHPDTSWVSGAREGIRDSIFLFVRDTDSNPHPWTTTLLSQSSIYNIVLILGLSDQGLGFQPPEQQVWYMLFIVFVPYAMLPLSLGWCITVGWLSSFSHVLATAVVLEKTEQRCYVRLPLL